MVCNPFLFRDSIPIDSTKHSVKSLEQLLVLNIYTFYSAMTS